MELKDKKALCPDCGTVMTIYGIRPSGVFMFHCSKCYRILNEVEARHMSEGMVYYDIM